MEAARNVAPHVYGPNVEVEINGENWHTECRNIMKIAAQRLQQENPAVPWSPSPAGSGASPRSPQTLGERSGSTMGHVKAEVLAAESAQGEVASIVNQMLAGGFKEDLTEAVIGLTQPAAAALYRLQHCLCELSESQSGAPMV